MSDGFLSGPALRRRRQFNGATADHASARRSLYAADVIFALLGARPPSHPATADAIIYFNGNVSEANVLANLCICWLAPRVMSHRSLISLERPGIAVKRPVYLDQRRLHTRVC